MDYGEIYYLERYICVTVSGRFAEQGFLSAFDFFCIVIWKSNRAKSKIARRLLAKGFSDLDKAVKALTHDIASQSTPKDRMRVMMRTWGFRIPMASAILAILYPDDFTIYDYRVMRTLRDCPPVKISRDFDRTWSQYQTFVERVRQAVPDERSLRDKDRYLWGRSFHNQLQYDIQHNFSTVDMTSNEDEE